MANSRQRRAMQRTREAAAGKRFLNRYRWFRWLRRHKKIKRFSGWGGIGTTAAVAFAAVSMEVDGAIKTAGAFFFAAWVMFAFAVYISDWWDKYRKWMRLSIAVLFIGSVVLFWSYLPALPKPTPTPLQSPDVALRFVSDPTYKLVLAVVRNDSPVLLEGLRYTIVFINITATLQGRPVREQFSRYEPNLNEFLASHTERNLGPAYLSPEFMNALRYGDTTVGSAVVECPRCSRARGYWLYFQVGKSGWFAETADGSLPELALKDRPGLKDFLDIQTWLRAKPLLEQKPIIIE